MDCYRFEKHIFKDGLLSNVDATFIIHLEGNGRLSSIQNQLRKTHPTNIVYIVFNKGYKKCAKDNIDTPSVDLVDAFLHIFKHARKQSFDNILILEDDFLFDEKIKMHSHIVDTFLSENKGKYMYMLGAIPYIQVPASLDRNHYTVWASTGTHACIYTKSLRDEILMDKNKISDWDVYTNLIAKRYTFYEALCFQLFPETENSKTWNNPLGLATILKTIFKCLGLDTQVEPGYSIFYIFSKIILVLIIFGLYKIIF